MLPLQWGRDCTADTAEPIPRVLQLKSERLANHNLDRVGKDRSGRCRGRSQVAPYAANVLPSHLERGILGRLRNRYYCSVLG